MLTFEHRIYVYIYMCLYVCWYMYIQLGLYMDVATILNDTCSSSMLLRWGQPIMDGSSLYRFMLHLMRLENVFLIKILSIFLTVAIFSIVHHFLYHYKYEILNRFVCAHGSGQFIISRGKTLTLYRFIRSRRFSSAWKFRFYFDFIYLKTTV